MSIDTIPSPRIRFTLRQLMVWATTVATGFGMIRLLVDFGSSLAGILGIALFSLAIALPVGSFLSRWRYAEIGPLVAVPALVFAISFAFLVMLVYLSQTTRPKAIQKIGGWNAPVQKITPPIQEAQQENREADESDAG